MCVFEMYHWAEMLREREREGNVRTRVKRERQGRDCKVGTILAPPDV